MCTTLAAARAEWDPAAAPCHELRQELVDMRLASKAWFPGDLVQFSRGGWGAEQLAEPRRPGRQPQKPPNANGYSLSGTSAVITNPLAMAALFAADQLQPHHR